MYRTQINKLNEWKLSPSRKPLLFMGARQVGKTWLLKEFGRTAYSKVAYVNFEHNGAPVDIFKQDLDINRIIAMLNAYCHIHITPGDTLIIFDELQAAQFGINALKYFCENAPQYHVAAAGSLLGVKIHPGESFPVGKVDFLHLGPMNFEEFLMALGHNELAEALSACDWQMLSVFHPQLMNLLRYYMFLGGMPAVVESFSADNDWIRARNLQKAILQSYSGDFSKHAPSAELPRISMVWDALPKQLAKENKKFIYGAIREGARAKDFEVAIQWLVDSGLVHKVANVSKPECPLKFYMNFDAFKLFHNDVGLLGAMAEVPMQTLVNGNSILTEFKGALAEQFTFQELPKDTSVFYHTFARSKYEIDFLKQSPQGIVYPVEVKSGENLTAKSLSAYCNEYAPRVAVKLSALPFARHERVVNVPLYAAGQVDKVIANLTEG